MLALIAKQRVISKTPKSLCLEYKSFIKGFGVDQDLKVCIRALGRKTQIKVYGKISVQKGRYPVPGMWQDPYETVKASLTKLFDEYLLGGSVKNQLAKHGENERTVMENIMQIVKVAGVEEYSKYLVLFMFVILLINTVILWTLVIAAERNQREILALTRLLVEAKGL
jgi:hypothetical protein